MTNARQLSFAGGEVTPSLYARVDQVKHATGLRTCRNMMVMRHGGATNRPGTGFVAEVKDSTKTVRLIPFIFNADQTYILEFGNLYMRVHKDGAQVTLAPSVITDITAADPPVVTTSAAHGLITGDEVYITGIVGMIELNNRNFKASYLTPTTFSLQTMDSVGLDASGYTAYSSDGTAAKIYELTTTYAESHLPALQYVQSADVVTIVHPSYIQRELTRTGDTAWAIADVTYGTTIAAPTNLLSDSPGSASPPHFYKVTTVDAETAEESLPSALEESSIATSTLTWDAVDGAGHYNVYKLLHGEYGWMGHAGAIASPTFKDNTYVPDLLDTPPVDRLPCDRGTAAETHDANTKLMLHCDDSGSDFADESASSHTIDPQTPPNNVSHSVTQKKFGTSCGWFDGDDFMTIPDHADWDFSADDIMTFDCWIKIVNTPGGVDYILHHETDANNNMFIRYTNVYIVEFGVTSGGVEDKVASQPLAMREGQWHHLACVSDGTNRYIFVDGVSEATAAISLSYANYTGANLYLGGDTSETYFVQAYIDEIRISNVARWTEDFPPPTEAYGKGGYPSAISLYQQRMMFGNTLANPEGVWTSKSALPKNFSVSTPLQDDDAVTFSLLGRQVNAIKHLLDMGTLIIFTTGGEWVVEGDTAGILLPGEINLKSYSANGSGDLSPLVVEGTAIYLQARSSVIRDLAYDFQSDGYKGNELSIFSAHLFESKTIVDWAYQQTPHSIVWCVRSDGTLLGMTYVREHQMNGWHRHDFDGTVENIAVVPSGTEDAVYMVIKRTIDGRDVRYIEIMKTRVVDDIRDSVFMDCSLSYDGRHTAGTTSMTLSGGSTWAYDEDLTLTSSVAEFAATDVGNAYWLTDTAGVVIRCVITAFTSTTVVTVRPHKDVPATLQAVATTVWSKAVDQVTGLWHLEGENVSVLVDGFVSANPNNTEYTVRTVTDGIVTFDDPHVVIHVGLPIVADIETLDIDTVQGSTLADKSKNISHLALYIEESRGIWAGPDSDSLRELKIRDEENYDDPIDLFTGVVDINLTGEWNNTGKVFIRQTDPLPMTILAVVPSGHITATTKG